MTAKERMQIAMNRGIPDRVPYWCLLSLEHIITHGFNNSKQPRTIEELVEAEIKLAKDYNFDGALIYLPGNRENSNIESFVSRSINDVPVGDGTNDFNTTDPDKWNLEIPGYSKKDFYSSHYARELVGSDFHLGGWAADGFSRAIQWFPSLEESMMAILIDPIKFKALVEYFDNLSVAWAKAQIELGKLESIQISSPYAGSSFISKESYENLVLPSVTRLAEEIKKSNGSSYIHTCGSINDRIELFADSGADGIECMDPPPLGNISLEAAKNRVGDRIFLKGNLDSVNILLQASDDEFESVVKNTIEIGKNNGGFILSSACSISRDVNPERIKNISKLIDKYGKY
jgi:uroporphyrinogen-III decarboxylase